MNASRRRHWEFNFGFREWCTLYGKFLECVTRRINQDWHYYRGWEFETEFVKASLKSKPCIFFYLNVLSLIYENEFRRSSFILSYFICLRASNKLKNEICLSYMRHYMFIILYVYYVYYIRHYMFKSSSS